MEWPGHVYARQMHRDLKQPGLELQFAICNYELPLLRQLLASLGQEPDHEADALKCLNLSISDWGSPLHIAVWCDSPEAVHALLEAGANPEANPHDDTPWVLAAKLGRREILCRFWSLIPIHRTARNFHGRASDCLARAASHGHTSTVRDILDRGVEWSENEKLAALIATAVEWQDNVAELLLSRLTYPVPALNEALALACNLKTLKDDCETTYEGFDSLHQERLVARLIHAGAEPNAPRACDGLHLVHLTASLTTLAGALKALLDNGFDPDVLGEHGRSALHGLGWPVRQREMASRPHRLNHTAASLLISHGASVFRRDKLGNTPFHYAAAGSDLHHFAIYTSACNSQELEEVLQLRNKAGETTLHWAAAGSKVDILGYLISMGLDLNLASHDGWTPFMCASAGDGTTSEVARTALLLLEHGANPAVVTADGWSALHTLARHLDANSESQLGHLAERVIHGGADVERRAPPLSLVHNRWRFHDSWPGGNGFSYKPACGDLGPSSSLAAPLHWAAEYGGLGVARALLAHGADPLARCSDGRLPIELAYLARTSRSWAKAPLSDIVVQEFFRLVRERAGARDRQGGS